ncbi:2TM domain-containing protein [Cognatitamlana onchidii]|uniref:2TM domain-containing protein n=1 Tax=Cognatitamlana onchidii TaxID=2562860 RepID=UPI0010A63E61|nr:2TM domain-containing protein [Algibacter onchidii]
METKYDEQERYIRAQKKVRNLKMFYIHLIGYIIVMALLAFNMYIAEGSYKDFFIWFDSIIMVGWTIFIVLHGCRVFYGKPFFGKTWEDKQARKYLEMEKETTIWK